MMTPSSNKDPLLQANISSYGGTYRAGNIQNHGWHNETGGAKTSNLNLPVSTNQPVSTIACQKMCIDFLDKNDYTVNQINIALGNVDQVSPKQKIGDYKFSYYKSSRNGETDFSNDYLETQQQNCLIKIFEETMQEFEFKEPKCELSHEGETFVYNLTWKKKNCCFGYSNIDQTISVTFVKPNDWDLVSMPNVLEGTPFVDGHDGYSTSPETGSRKSSPGKEHEVDTRYGFFD
jgi:hypothetical protein